MVSSLDALGLWQYSWILSSYELLQNAAVAAQDASGTSNSEENANASDINEEDKTSDEQNETSVVPKESESSVPEDKDEGVHETADSPRDAAGLVNLSNGSEVSVKVEHDSPSTNDEAPCLNEAQKETSMEVEAQADEEASATSESETSVKDNASAGSEDFRMDVDLPSTDVKTEVIEDQEKSTDSGIVSEQSARKIPQKRSCEDDLASSQAKKQCLPDIVCGDANALDLSGMKKKDVPKEPKIALKPQSLLLSKLTSDVDKSKKDTYRNDDSVAQTAEPIISSKPSRRRSSRDEKDSRSSQYQRRSAENNTARVQVDQVLREMRTRVRSSYKEREKVAKEDSLLRDLLEPERDTVMTDFVDTATQGGSVTELDRVSAALDAEIRQLTVEINAKEAEWNDLIRKKKFKEELALRVQRRKQVLALTGETDDQLLRRNSLEDDVRSDTKRESNADVRHDRRHDNYREVPKTEELLAAALRLGSRNVEDYHRRSNSSSPLARVGAVSSHSSAGLACRQLSSSVSLSALPTSTSTSSVLNASLPSTAVHKNLSRVEKQLSAASASRMQRPILPKPSTATSGGHVVSDSSQDGSGKGIIGEGRQGAIIDVQSIIADYRSQHPENVPRRGRRMKSSGMVSDSIMASARPGSSSGGGLLMSLPALGSGSHVRSGSGNSLHSNAPVDLSELGFVLSSGAGSDGPSRPSSTESSLSGAPSQVNPESGMSFKDVLVQFAKMTDSANALNTQAPGRPPPPPYPEVTLHPVVNPTPVASPVPAASTPPTSLLHNILTKPNNQSSNNGNQSHAKPTTFSPTLARLLTAPERSSSVAHHSTHHSAPVLPQYQPAAVSHYGTTGSVLLSDLLSVGPSKKARSELTITPVSASSAASNTSLPSTKRNSEVVVLDADVNGDEGDASDPDERRLVIDEGDNVENGDDTDGRSDRSKNAVPHCQGCNERDAEFVCAGCQRQWYCSRECQIAAWDEHSEQCFPASNDN